MDPARHKQEVGRRLRTALQALNLKQADLSREFGDSPQKINNWLRGDNYPDEWFLYRFCSRYGVSTDYLYRGVVTGVSVPALASALFSAEEGSRGASPAPADQERGRE